MKLATLKDGSRDGMLAVVSRDHKTAHLAMGIAPTLQRALDDWNFIGPQLEDLYGQLNSGRAKRAFEFVPAHCMAPLPRAYQWADGSIYQQHVELLTRAFSGKLPDNLWREPMMYQGGGDDFIGPCDPAPFAEEHWGIDFEPELGVILGDTPMQVRRDEALDHVCLLVLINDWSLRNLVAGELAKGFGFFQSKPATAFAPLAITPDELGEAWRDGLAAVRVKVDWNGTAFMQANAGEGTRFSFAELIAHAAKTRNLRPGTIVGSGTVSGGGAVGCIAELRAREVLEARTAGEDGKQRSKPRTEFMKFGDSVRIEAFDAQGHSVFGAIDQQVSAYRRRRAPAGGNPAASAAETVAGEAVPPSELPEEAGRVPPIETPAPAGGIPAVEGAPATGPDPSVAEATAMAPEAAAEPELPPVAETVAAPAADGAAIPVEAVPPSGAADVTAPPGAGAAEGDLPADRAPS